MKYQVRCTERDCHLETPAHYDDCSLALWVRNAHRRNSEHLVVVEYRDPANPDVLQPFNPDAAGALNGGAP